MSILKIFFFTMSKDLKSEEVEKKTDFVKLKLLQNFFIGTEIRKKGEIFDFHKDIARKLLASTSGVFVELQK
jgi:hypothetical protein